VMIFICRGGDQKWYFFDGGIIPNLWWFNGIFHCQYPW
jgi:hypothetical protein